MKTALQAFPADQRRLAAWLALLRTPGIGSSTFAKLLARCADPLEWVQGQVEGLGAAQRQALETMDWSVIAHDLAWQQADRHILSLDDPRYPSLLLEIPDPPPLLFCCGDIEHLQAWQLAVVGSRNPSPSGRQTAADFAYHLAEMGLVITSGLATGIDAAAHEAALKAGGNTIAVVATGLDRVYPAKHRDLAHRIREHGLLVSEFPLGTPPRPDHFPRRNRIISGLSLGTLVVEAAVQSGSLITARMAMEQGREVFAIPGSIHNPLVRGCHQLIRQGAKLVETAQDILEELSALAGVRMPDLPANDSITADSSPALEADPEYQTLLEHLGYDPLPIDQLIAQSGLTIDRVSSMLLRMELAGLVDSLPGGRYVRVGS